MILFRNKGLIDPLAITTMGVNVKDGDHPIGQFGTGIKFAIAVVLRNGGEFTIWRGGEALRFAAAEQEIRGKKFGIVTMNGDRLGFATNLGPHWETWMAFREVYCNCTDESGYAQAWDGDIFDPGDDETVVAVTGADFDKHYQNRGAFVLTTQPLLSLPGVDVHPGKTDAIFYRGIRAGKLDKPAAYTYNFTGYQILTEDRTLKYTSWIPGDVAKAAVQAMSDGFLVDLLTAKEGSFEHKLPWDDVRDATPSDKFMEIAESLRAQSKLHGTAIKLYSHHKERHAAAYAMAHTVKPSVVQARILRKACDLLSERVVPVLRYTFVLKSLLPGDMMAAAVAGGTEIQIRESLLEKGADATAHALLIAIAKTCGGAREDRLADFILTGNMKTGGTEEELEAPIGDIDHDEEG
jgi:hypothetical protein